MDTKEYLKTVKKLDYTDNPEECEKLMGQIREYNKVLVEKYPWLKPEQSYYDISPWMEQTREGWNYEYTWLDDMDSGWRIAFGEKMCEEIHAELVKFNFVDKYSILQIKEKYGTLRWYDGGCPVGKLSDEYEEIIKKESGYPRYSENEYIEYKGQNENGEHVFRKYKITDKCMVHDIIDKYEQISFSTCIECGQSATKITKGYIIPLCDKCGYGKECDILVNITKLDEKAKIPTRASRQAAGYDLYACLDEKLAIPPDKTVKIGTGIAMGIPNGYYGAVYARSGLACKHGLRPANCVGIIDSDYRGEICVFLHNDSAEAYCVEPGERIAQMIIQTCFRDFIFNEVDKLEETERGEGGFGHSGKF